MSAAISEITPLLRQTLRDPQDAARRLIALNPPLEARILALLFVSVIAIMLARLSLMIAPAEEMSPFFALLSDPYIGVPIQAAVMGGLALAMSLGGRMVGGTGRFTDALLLVVWMEFVLTLLQVVQVVAFLVFPALGVLVAIVALGLFFWLLTNFAAALHGFISLVKVFFGMLLSLFALAFAIVLLLSIFGISLPVPAA